MLRAIANQFRKPKRLLGRYISSTMKEESNLAYQMLLENFEIKDNEHLFEIGFGPGVGIEQILSQKHCYVSGVDFSNLMYNEAVQRNKKFIDGNRCQLYLDDFLSFNLKESEYDKIICINVIYFWDDLKKPLKKIRKGLKENGEFCFFMLTPNKLNKLKFTKDDIFTKHTIEEVIAELKLAGFCNINYKYNKGYLVQCEK